MRSWRWPSRDASAVFIAICLLRVILNVAVAAGAESEFVEGLEERLLAVNVNGHDLHDVSLFLLHRDGSLFIREADLERWRISLPARTLVSHAGHKYYPIDSQGDISFHIDDATQTIFLEARANAFQRTSLSGLAGALGQPQSAPALGALLNYDLSAQHTSGGAQLGALLEQAVFHRSGVGVNGFLAQKVVDHSRVVRLESSWTTDRPDWLASLRLGDTISQGGSWGRSVRFGGIQWATNFAIRPDLVTFPLPALAGEATLPSTLDLYVNNALRLRREIPSGPFTIDNVPVVTGAGDITLVVRDLLGRERVITQAYYASPRLLQQGLREYSYEAGFLRRNFGQESFEYGSPFGSGTYRLGITDSVSGEIRGEVMARQQAIGIGTAMLWQPLGLWYSAIAGSHSRQGLGSLWLLGVERQTARLSFGANLQFETSHFATAAQQHSVPAAKLRSQAFVGFRLGAYGALSLRYLQQDNRGRADVSVFNTNYNLSLPRIGFLNLYLSTPIKERSNWTFGLSFTRKLSERTNASVNTTVRSDSSSTALRLQRNLPPGEGFGYRLETHTGDQKRVNAEVNMQNGVGTYSLETSHTLGQTGVRGSAMGGLVFLDGKAFLTRTLSRSFALVRVPGHPNVRVYADNHMVGRTDAEGYALVPQLRSYERNPIYIEQADLPLDAEIEATHIDAVPPFRAGVLLSFPVRRAQGALLTIRTAGGDPLPSGAIVRVMGQAQNSPVGLNGQVYITGLMPTNRLHVVWRGQSCELTVSLPDAHDLLPDLGTFTCEEIR